MHSSYFPWTKHTHTHKIDALMKSGQKCVDEWVKNALLSRYPNTASSYKLYSPFDIYIIYGIFQLYMHRSIYTPSTQSI